MYLYKTSSDLQLKLMFETFTQIYSYYYWPIVLNQDISPRKSFHRHIYIEESICDSVICDVGIFH